MGEISNKMQTAGSRLNTIHPPLHLSSSSGSIFSFKSGLILAYRILEPALAHKFEIMLQLSIYAETSNVSLHNFDNVPSTLVHLFFCLQYTILYDHLLKCSSIQPIHKASLLQFCLAVFFNIYFASSRDYHPPYLLRCSVKHPMCLRPPLYLQHPPQSTPPFTITCSLTFILKL